MSKPDSNFFPHSPAIALVGNPGAGKSTLLNGLAGSPQFRSGPSLGEGLTQDLQAYSVGHMTLYDTPGLLDAVGSKRSGEELDKLLSENVDLKIAFVVILDEGRPRVDDFLTIKLVLDAISIDTNDRFGVVVNKMGEKVKEMIREDPVAEFKTRQILTGAHTTSHWCYVPLDLSLLVAKDQCHISAELNLFLLGLPVTKPVGTVVSKIATQELEDLLLNAERRVRKIERSTPDEIKEMMAGNELQKHAVEEHYTSQKQAMGEQSLKNAIEAKELQNIEDERHEVSVEHDVEVDYNQHQQVEDDATDTVHVQRRFEFVGDVSGNPGEDREVQNVHYRQTESTDSVRSVEFYNRAIEERGDVPAMYNLAAFLTNGGDGIPADPVRAVELYNRAIEEGDNVDAMYNLALLFRDGRDGLPADPVRSVELFNRAIEEGGDVDAMCSLASLLKDGKGTVQANPSRAVELYTRAIEEGGSVSAMFSLAYLLQDDGDGLPAAPVRAVELYTRAIEEGGSVIAMNNLAWLLQNGADGVPADSVRAAELYNCAIEKDGNVLAMHNLALLLKDGKDAVPADPVRAVELFNRCIEEGGHVPSMNNLAILLQSGGEGVPADPRHAVVLYTRAIEEGGCVESMLNLADLLQVGGDGVSADPKKAVELYTRAIDEGGCVEAMVHLADLLLVGGEGVQTDGVCAADLNTRASE